MMYLYHLTEESVEAPISSSLSVKVFLEGAFSNPNSISNIPPNNQPYYQTPFNYKGNEFFNTLPNENC